MARDEETAVDPPTLTSSRHRPGSDPVLIVCRCFSVFTAVVAVLCVAVNVLSAVLSFKNGSDIFGGIFRCYAVVIALFVAVAETEWSFIMKFCTILEYWAARGMLQIFVAVMTRAFTDVYEKHKELVLLQEIASYLLMACGLTYIISGVLCIGFLKRARQHKNVTVAQATKDLEMYNFLYRLNVKRRADSAAVAITTTDLVSKSVAIESEVGGQPIKIGGMAKGSGMIHPNMATMLGVITTDALVTSNIWREMVRTSVNRSFNQITVDGDTSTNDCVIALASGLSGSTRISSFDSSEAHQLQSCLDAVMQGLAKSIAWDGEGATCLIEVSVTGANNEAEAAKFARSVASSSLVKAAVYGRDPNWGRIACAVGYAGIHFNPNDLNITLGDIPLMNRGQPLQFDSAAASNYLKHAGEIHGTVEIHISVGGGLGMGKAWGCDLSYDYVKINAEYTT